MHIIKYSVLKLQAGNVIEITLILLYGGEVLMFLKPYTSSGQVVI